MTTSGIGPLNLSDADTSGFEAIDPGRYNAEVFQITMDAVKNTRGEGKMPAGTPMVKVQFKLISDAAGKEEGILNRRAFVTYVIPPKDYDKAKAAKIKGMLANFFIALGESEETVRSNKFDPDFEDYIGRPCVVVLGKEPKRDSAGNVIPDEYNNPVKGVKPAGSLVGATQDSGLL
jgi:hypothetical protein